MAEEVDGFDINQFMVTTDALYELGFPEHVVEWVRQKIVERDRMPREFRGVNLGVMASELRRASTCAFYPFHPLEERTSDLRKALEDASYLAEWMRGNALFYELIASIPSSPFKDSTWKFVRIPSEYLNHRQILMICPICSPPQSHTFPKQGMTYATKINYFNMQPISFRGLYRSAPSLFIGRCEHCTNWFCG